MLDWVLAAAVAVLVVFAPVTGGSGSHGTWWGGIVSIVGASCQGLGVLLRRSRPMAAAALALVGYAVISVGVGLTPPFGPWVLIWSTGSSWAPDGRRPRLAVGATVTTIVLIALAELARPGVGAWLPLAAGTVALALTALLVRADRGRVEAVRVAAAAEERLRIARDVHDVVGHALAVVAVQSSTARLALDAGDPVSARQAIRVVEETSRTAMREMRQTLSALSAPSSEAVGSSRTGLGDVTQLVRDLQAAGVPVSWESSGSWQEAPPDVQRCAYRVVQEGVTNALKHAAGAPIEVRVDRHPGSLAVAVASAVAVANAGEGLPSGERPGAGTGMGLAGLAARVEALGGQFHAGPSAGGWLVEAVLPIPAPPTTGVRGVAP
ncbi:MAG TPA: histidine kinase [Candidatus Nanopelagicales bacterium]